MTKEEAKLKLERVEEIIQRYKNDMEGWIDESKRLQEIIDKKDDCWAGGFKCDDCGNIQGLWNE